MDRAAPRWAYLPTAAGGVESKERARPAGEHCRQLPPELSDVRVPGRVHAAMEPVQARVLKPVLDRVRAGAGLEQLRASDHAVLRSGEPRDELIELEGAQNVRCARGTPCAGL